MNIEIPEQHADAADAYGDGFAAGASAERSRIAAILNSSAGNERPAIARKLAMLTDMTAEAAVEIMTGLPAERPTSQIPSLAERHAAAGGGAGADGPGGAEAWAGELRRGSAPATSAVMRRAIHKTASTTNEKKG